MGRSQRPLAIIPFARILEQAIGEPGMGQAQSGPHDSCRNPKGRLCQLCWAGRLDYALEQRRKAEALLRWADQIPSLPPPQWLPSPLGRNYRRLSKRRWLSDNRQLVMVEKIERGRILGIAPRACQIEPLAHAQIYHWLQQELLHSSLGRRLQYAIVRSCELGEVLLLNLNDLHSQRAELNRISKKICHHFPNLRAVWLIEGQEGDEYYANVRAGQWQKLHGEGYLADPLGLHYSPLCFAQVNSSCLKSMLAIAKDWLGDPSWPLLDLYCGYGLFSLGLARTGSCWGLDIAGESVLWARRNAKRMGQDKAKFEVWDLSQREIASRRFPQDSWVAVLDPPRSGAPEELITQVAQARPRKVVHWICDSEQLQPQLRAWIESGYRVTRAFALDMFAGTDSLELGLCLEPGGRLPSAKPAHRVQKSTTGTDAPCQPPKKPEPLPATSKGGGSKARRPRP